MRLSSETASGVSMISERLSRVRSWSVEEQSRAAMRMARDSMCEGRRRVCRLRAASYGDETRWEQLETQRVARMDDAGRWAARTGRLEPNKAVQAWERRFAALGQAQRWGDGRSGELTRLAAGRQRLTAGVRREALGRGRNAAFGDRAGSSLEPQQPSSNVERERRRCSLFFPVTGYGEKWGDRGRHGGWQTCGQSAPDPKDTQTHTSWWYFLGYRQGVEWHVSSLKRDSVLALLSSFSKPPSWTFTPHRRNDMLYQQLLRD